ncbi:condensation domain-containing protein [Paenibacillus aurantiacus]|uniref:Condensation domain-containing protein n=1 Tax=Paenibacillus aurantiacus TaxID=1936118 RepID=A0ABV5KMH0_9BACL
MLDVTGFRFHADDDAEETETEESREEISPRDIAIIGIGVRMPDANDITQFWRNLREGKDSCAPFPAARAADAAAYMSAIGINPDNVDYFDGAYLNEIDKFDPGFFRMSPRDAALTSPAQRLFLQTAWSAIEDAGYGGGNLKGASTGVYIGCSADAIHDYKRLIEQEDPSGIPIAIPGNLTSVIASRISYVLDLKGPALSVDTACSSSLAAVHLACQAIRAGDCETAIAGSVKTLLLPADTGMRVGIESKDGRARTFDDASEGTGMGEGTAAVLLKPLARALADGDSVYAVVKGSAMNQDGSSAGITAPNAAAQEEALVQAWLSAGIDPATVSYIEAHGTGTKLGDPIEIEGISRAFRRFTDNAQFCAIGSVKTNIGHLDHAAGIAGLVKAALALHHKELPPSLHFNRPNRHIDFIESPVYVNDRLAPWPSGLTPRRCGVSAFGLSGTNCHVVLEEAPLMQDEPQAAGVDAEACLFVLSARSADSLARSAGAYAEFLAQPGHQELNLADICYTASTGRSHFEHRLAYVVSDTEELIRMLRQVAASRYVERGATGGSPDRVAPVEPARELIGQAAREGFAALGKERLERLGQLYEEGADIPWEQLYGSERRRRLHLPTYVFDNVRCWVETKRVPAPRESGGCSVSGEQHVEPKTIDAASDTRAIEETIAELWEGLLGVRPGETDDFFALGGHSLSAVQLAAQLGSAFGMDLQPAQVFTAPTVGALADEIRRHTLSLPDRIKPIEGSGPYPASSAQRRLFILSELHDDNIGYNMPALLEIEGEVEEARFIDALRTLFARHESLRTTFGWQDGEIVQRIHADAEPVFERLQIDESGIESAVRSFVRPFRLDRLPLLRIGMLTTPEGRRLLLFDMHHIISDGYSIGKLTGELATLYAGDDLPPLRIQYKDYAAWQSSRIESGALLAHERYWQSRFAHPAPRLRFPSDRLPHRQRLGSAEYEGRTVFFETDAALSKGLNALAAETGTTLFMVLLAVFGVLLAERSGQDDLIVGTAVAGRTRVELEPLIGMFVNTLPLRQRPSAGKTFRQFLAEVKADAREALAFQEYPFERLADTMSGDAGADNSPAILDVMYIHQNTTPPVLRFGDASLRPHPFDFGIAKFDMALQSWETREGLAFALEYRTSRFEHRDMTEWTEKYVRLLRHAVATDDFALEEMFTGAKARRRLEETDIRARKETVFAEFDF